MANSIKPIRGVRDIRPPEVWIWNRIEDACRRVFGAYGYDEIKAPLIEATELFARAVGATTDIVEKEMYTFADRKGRSITLRPEGTAGVVRAYIEAGLAQANPTSRFWYGGPMFRYERPQKGRYRQFYQIGVEAFGVSSPRLDAEVVAMLSTLMSELGLEGIIIQLNSLGDGECRPAYRDKLKAYLEGIRDQLCAQCQKRIETNPLRVLDCKNASCQAVTKEAPLIKDALCDPCREHFATVIESLDGLGVKYEINDRIVRGLDYYVRTTFELIATSSLGSQDAVCGGGRYDGLVKDLGGPDVPGIGFALGLDRMALVYEDQKGPVQPTSVYLVAQVEPAMPKLFALASDLRARGIRTAMDYELVSVKAQMRRANRTNARFALILGEKELEAGEITVKDLSDGSESTVSMDAVAGKLLERKLQWD